MAATKNNTKNGGNGNESLILSIYFNDYLSSCAGPYHTGRGAEIPLEGAILLNEDIIEGEVMVLVTKNNDVKLIGPHERKLILNCRSCYSVEYNVLIDGEGMTYTMFNGMFGELHEIRCIERKEE